MLSPSPSPAVCRLSANPWACRRRLLPHDTLVVDITPVVTHFSSPALPPEEDTDQIWAELRREAELEAEEEPTLHSLYHTMVLAHPSLESSLASYLAGKLSIGGVIHCSTLRAVIVEVLEKDAGVRRAVRADLAAARERDPACSRMVHCFLYYKGFLALQTHRVAHRLWRDGRRALALFLQGRSSEMFAVDIHPGARIGSGILLDHATGVVIGETATVGDNVSILHSVTLGGTGKEAGDRHPKICPGVLVGAGTHILGNVSVGEGAKIGAGSVVLQPVPPRTTAVGNPARLLAPRTSAVDDDAPPPSLTMDHTSWSDYVI